MNTFAAAFGTFPYPEMDVVLTSFASFGGMEYPTIIFTNPGKLTISHELAHQYWYGIVGDDEFSAPWLDESFATWSSVPAVRWMEEVPALPLAGGRCADHERHGVLEGAPVRVRHDLRRRRLSAREPGAPVRSGPLHRGSCTTTRRITGWVSTRTEDFKAAIEAAARADGCRSIPTCAYWSTWRVD